MTREELIELAKDTASVNDGVPRILARAFLEADAEREKVGQMFTDQCSIAGKLAAERDAARAEVEAFKAARYAYASEFDGDEGNIHQNIRALKAELSALRAEIEAAPVVYAAQGDALVWHRRRDDGDIGYYDTHRARLVRIEPMSPALCSGCGDTTGGCSCRDEKKS